MWVWVYMSDTIFQPESKGPAKGLHQQVMKTIRLRHSGTIRHNTGVKRQK